LELAKVFDAPQVPDSVEARLAKIECILFDLDGTLVDTIELILCSFRHATEQVLGEALPDDVVLADVGVPLATQMRSFSEEHADELLRAYREHNAVHHDDLIREYPGVEDVLCELRARGYKLGVVTSKLNHMACRGLDCFDLRPFVDVVIGADDVEIHKPDPHPLLVAAEQLGSAPERCVYVGDAPPDMQAARGAGMVSIAALWGGAHSDERVLAENPDIALSDVRQLPHVMRATPRLEGRG
jgi:pyrophosphatase PpaX